MSDSSGRQTSREAGVRGDLIGRREGNGEPMATLRTNEPGTSNPSVTDLAWSAVIAGHSSRSIHVQSGAKGKFKADRNKTVLSGLQQDSLTAEAWMGMYERKGAIREDILGAGTPFVCLYLFGWAFGKHVAGWIFGGAAVVLCWAFLVNISMTKGCNSGELWLEDAVVLVFSIAFFYSRLDKRTPPGFKYSGGFWVALLLEAVLANTLSCVAHGFGLIMDDPQRLHVPKMIVRTFKFGLPVAGWAFLCTVAQEWQAQALREKNMGKSGRPTTLGLPSPHIVHLVMKIMDRSRDLRVTGLNEGELENLARFLHDEGYDEVAKYIVFYTRNNKAVDTFDLLLAFHRGYMSWMTAGGGHIFALVEDYASSSFKSVDSILRTEHEGRRLILKLPRELEQIESDRSFIDREPQGWWLCGAIASYLDHGGDMARRSDSLSWYALTAAVLCKDHNAMAVIAARNLSSSMDFNDADEIWPRIVEGCRQVLDKVTGDENISSARGLVVTTMRPEEHPVVTYTAAEVWKAEQGREPFMLDRDSFNKLRVAQPVVGCGGPSLLSDDSKRDILERSVALASRVRVRVNFVPVLIHQRIHTRALDDVRATAWLGWLMHVVWVICAIVIHLIFPEYLHYLSTFASFATYVDRTNLLTHVVFVGFHLWRKSPFGRIALKPQFARMDDSDISVFASWAYWTSVFVVSWLGVYMGTLPGFWCRVCFLVTLIGPIIPGLVYIVFEGDNHGAEGSIQYMGRSKGRGYEHRDPEIETRVLRRPVGKDVVVRVGSTFRIASYFLHGQDAVGTNDDRDEPSDA